MNLPELLPHFDNYRKVGPGRYKASCPMPGHNDSDPSVSITQRSDTGKILLYCFGCGAGAEEMVRVLNLTKRDLFGDPGHPDAMPAQDIEPDEVPEAELAKLERYLAQTADHLEQADDYIAARFGLSVAEGKSLRLGVDPGNGGIVRPEGYEQFKDAAHLIIPFLDPTGKPVGMQGRRLASGEPRWRSTRGKGWSQIGCFGWDLPDPVIITEGPSDALSVVGLGRHPALAIRGASLTADSVCQQIREWLNGRTAVVIGDNGEPGRKFTREISEKVNASRWELPEEYGDLSEYLGDGGNLDSAVQAAIPVTAVEESPTITSKEKVDGVLAKILRCGNVRDAQDNEEIADDIASFSVSEHSDLFDLLQDHAADLTPRGGYLGATRNRINRWRRETTPPPVRGGGHNAPPVGGQNDGGRPQIVWNTLDQFGTSTNNLRDAMNLYHGDEYYQAARGSYLQVITNTEADEDDLQALDDAGVKRMLSAFGQWHVGVNGDIGHPPKDAIDQVTSSSWVCNIDTIKRRVSVPFMLGDGSIVSSSGFHEGSGVYLLPKRNDLIVVPEVPLHPTQSDIDTAKRILEDALDGFVFKNQASKTNLLAMTLTSPLRELFQYNPMVPLLVSTAPQSGSGKGTSIRLPLATAGIGNTEVSPTRYNSDENEFEKKLVAQLLKKNTYIFLDNIRTQVNSAVLEQMLTAANYDGRTLGHSEVNSLSTLVLWVSTLQSDGSFNRDLIRRCVPVELEKNEQGTWAHKNIERYLSDMRGELIWASFVVARKWLNDGAINSDVRLDGYGGWTEVIGGILENVLGYDGFLENLSGFRKSQDSVAMELDSVLERWFERYGTEEKPARFAVEGDYDDPDLLRMLDIHQMASARQVIQALERKLSTKVGFKTHGHRWELVGLKVFGNEQPRQLYRFVPLTED